MQINNEIIRKENDNDLRVLTGLRDTVPEFKGYLDFCTYCEMPLNGKDNTTYTWYRISEPERIAIQALIKTISFLYDNPRKIPFTFHELYYGALHDYFELGHWPNMIKAAQDQRPNSVQ